MSTMPLLPRAVATFYFNTLTRESETPPLQGEEGRLLLQISQNAWQHWADGLSGLLTENQTLDDYQPVPPKRSFKVKVRYQLQGRGQSLPYLLDEE